MSILDTYDDFNFTVILLFLYICLFTFIVIIINNVKRKRLYQQKLNRNRSYAKMMPNSMLVVAYLFVVSTMSIIHHVRRR